MNHNEKEKLLNHLINKRTYSSDFTVEFWRTREAVLHVIHDLIQTHQHPITFTPNYLAKQLDLDLNKIMNIVFRLVNEKILMMEISFPCQSCNKTILNYFQNEFEQLQPVNKGFCHQCNLPQKHELKDGLVFLHIFNEYYKHIKNKI